MKIQVRDDAISRNKQTVRLVLTACIAQSVVIVALAGLTIYAFLSKRTVYIPLTGGEPYVASDLKVSPGYLREVAGNIMQMRLTWNSDTVVPRYKKLLEVLAPKEVSDFQQKLNTEVSTIKKRHISSVFYQSSAKVDVSDMLAQISGTLYRIDEGVTLPPVKRKYQIRFRYNLGTLYVVSIDEVHQNA